MLGIDDGFVGLAYVLCIASTVLCVLYAWMNWNRGDDTVGEEDKQWEEEEGHVEEKL